MGQPSQPMLADRVRVIRRTIGSHGAGVLSGARSRRHDRGVRHRRRRRKRRDHWRVGNNRRRIARRAGRDSAAAAAPATVTEKWPPAPAASAADLSESDQHGDLDCASKHGQTPGCGRRPGVQLRWPDDLAQVFPHAENVQSESGKIVGQSAEPRGSFCFRQTPPRMPPCAIMRANCPDDRPIDSWQRQCAGRADAKRLRWRQRRRRRGRTGRKNRAWRRAAFRLRALAAATARIRASGCTGDQNHDKST
jgi:hypothetical protein